MLRHRSLKGPPGMVCFKAVAAHIATVDGTTQPGYAGSPLIEIDGSAAGPAADGLVVEGIGTVRGLVINRFARHGVGGGVAADDDTDHPTGRRRCDEDPAVLRRRDGRPLGVSLPSRQTDALVPTLAT